MADSYALKMNDRRSGLRSILRRNLEMAGIDFNDLKPGCVRQDGDSIQANVEIMMALEGISVQDLKEGTYYQVDNEEDRKKLIHDDEAAILKMMNDLKNEDNEAKKKRKDDPVIKSRLTLYGGCCYSYEEYVAFCAIPKDDPCGFQKALANRRKIYGLEDTLDPDEEGMVFDPMGRPMPGPVPCQGWESIPKVDPSSEFVEAIANYQKHHKPPEGIFDSDGRPIPVKTSTLLDPLKAIPDVGEDDDEKYINNKYNKMMKKMKKGPEFLGEAAVANKDDPFQYQKIMDKGKKLLIDYQEEDEARPALVYSNGRPIPMK